MNVIMFHSVGNTGPVWFRNWLSVDENHFDRFCNYLKNNNFNTLFLDEWYFLQDNKSKLKGNELVLTFDDGYLDNWVFVYPILKKYGLKGTIFINPEFVDPGNVLRPLYNGKTRESLTTVGFVNWPEIIAMQQSGVIDIQSHSMSHDFYFHTSKVIDIYSGQPEFDWLAWNSHNQRKPFYLTENQSDFNPKGMPVFEYYRALGLRRYFPDEKINEFGTENLGRMPKNQLIEKLNHLVETQCPGRFETDEELEKRYRYELFESKRILEEKLKKPVDFLCWPGGGYNELSVKLSKEAGYIASTISSRDFVKNPENQEKYKRIKRFGMGSFINTSKKKHLSKNPNHLVNVFRGKNGSGFYKNLNRLNKLYYMSLDYINL